MVDINFNVNDFRVKSVDLNNISNVNKWLHQNKFEVNDLWSSFISYYITDGEIFLAIERLDGSIVGILRGTIEDEKKIFITCYILEENCSNDNIKHDIFECLIDYINESGISEIFIGISDDDFISRQFWKDKGFTQLRRIKSYFSFKNTSRDLLILTK